jgi:hypothetical protein
LCWLVNLRSEKVVENWTLEIEYYPLSYVRKNSDCVGRKLLQVVVGTHELLNLTGDSFLEAFEKKQYILTKFRSSVSMNWNDCVNCGYGAYTYYNCETIRFVRVSKLKYYLRLSELMQKYSLYLKQMYSTLNVTSVAIIYEYKIWFKMLFSDFRRNCTIKRWIRLILAQLQNKTSVTSNDLHVIQKTARYRYIIALKVLLKVILLIKI